MEYLPHLDNDKYLESHFDEIPRSTFESEASARARLESMGLDKEYSSITKGYILIQKRRLDNSDSNLLVLDKPERVATDNFPDDVDLKGIRNDRRFLATGEQNAKDAPIGVPMPGFKVGDIVRDMDDSPIEYGMVFARHWYHAFTEWAYAIRYQSNRRQLYIKLERKLISLSFFGEGDSDIGK